jgi:hypothetical protein
MLWRTASICSSQTHALGSLRRQSPRFLVGRASLQHYSSSSRAIVNGHSRSSLHHLARTTFNPRRWPLEAAARRSLVLPLRAHPYVSVQVQGAPCGEEDRAAAMSSQPSSYSQLGGAQPTRYAPTRWDATTRSTPRAARLPSKAIANDEPSPSHRTHPATHRRPASERRCFQPGCAPSPRKHAKARSALSAPSTG